MSEDVAEACNLLLLIERDWLERMANLLEADCLLDAEAKADLSARIEQERMELRALGAQT